MTGQQPGPAPHSRGRGPYGLTAAQLAIARRNLAVEAELLNGTRVDIRL